MQLDKQTLENYFDRLWPLPRSITGKGFRDSLDILSELIPLQQHTWNSGEDVHDWVVPLEWNVNGASIWSESDGKTIVDFKDNNLHLVGYSEPRAGLLPWKLLREHVHTLPEMYEAIPYITSYFKRSWGFCMTHWQYLELEKEPEARYYFNIDTTLQPGKLVVGDLIKSGETTKEILLSTYLCHPMMANNELTGPLVLAGVYQKLLDVKLHHTLRFYVGPENIGAVAYLSRFGKDLKQNLVAGLVLTCLGLGPQVTYKKSRRPFTWTNLAAKNVLDAFRKRKGLIEKAVTLKEFFPDGCDERQLCSPGYDLPVGVLMRRGYWDYKEYHTSLDNKELISFDTIMESIDIVTDIVLTIDKSKIYRSTVQYGTPMFSKTEQGNDLYAPTMKLNNFYRGEGHRQAMLEIINSSDGETDLLSIAELYGRKMLDIVPIAERLVDAGYLEEVT